jgi:hypothetical protein
MSSSITYRGAVFYAEFADARPGEVVQLPLSYQEARDLGGAVERNGGIVVESAPKRLIAFFPRPAEALAQSHFTLERVDKIQRADAARAGVSTRIVLAFGSATLQAGRLRSDWTQKLPELVSLVQANSIAATSDFVAQFPPGLINPPPKPLGGGLNLLAGSGEPAPNTEARARSAMRQSELGMFTAIEISVRGVPRTFRSSQCPLLVGRDTSCAIQLKGDTTSRVHGRIEYFNDKFHYVDDSRNGSWVLTSSGEELHLEREKIVLIGEGAISPGAPLKEQTGEVLRFACRSSKLSTESDETRPLKRR